jgi:LysR family transcriptional activator of nhaA
MDVVISDGPADTGRPGRVYSHLLGECGTTFFAAPRLATAAKQGFPRSLDGVAFLLPGPLSAVRRAIEQWFDAEGIRPRMVA